MQEAWNYSPVELPLFESITPPEHIDMNFDVQDMRNPSKSLVWLDYTLFTMDMHNRWAEELSETLHTIHPDRLITVGQDEALCSQRPTPFFSMLQRWTTQQIIHGGNRIILSGMVYLRKHMKNRISFRKQESCT